MTSEVRDPSFRHPCSNMRRRDLHATDTFPVGHVTTTCCSEWVRRYFDVPIMPPPLQPVGWLEQPAPGWLGPSMTFVLEEGRCNHTGPQLSRGHPRQSGHHEDSRTRMLDRVSKQKCTSMKRVNSLWTRIGCKGYPSSRTIEECTEAGTVHGALINHLEYSTGSECCFATMPRLPRSKASVFLSWRHCESDWNLRLDRHHDMAVRLSR